MAWGLDIDKWNEIGTVSRAQMVAHFLHRSMREAYSSDHALKKIKKQSKGDSKGKGEPVNLHKLDSMLAMLQKHPRKGIEIMDKK